MGGWQGEEEAGIGEVGGAEGDTHASSECTRVLHR